MPRFERQRGLRLQCRETWYPCQCRKAYGSSRRWCRRIGKGYNIVQLEGYMLWSSTLGSPAIQLKLPIIDRNKTRVVVPPLQLSTGGKEQLAREDQQ